MSEPNAKPKHLTLYDLLFCIGLALLLTHEMDAMTHAEWRLLPGLSWMDDQAGLFYFVVLHVPLFTLILWLTASTSTKFRGLAQAAVDGFLIIHVGLHTLLSSHPLYEFDSTLSLSLIYGAGLFGGLHLLLLWQRRRNC